MKIYVILSFILQYFTWIMNHEYIHAKKFQCRKFPLIFWHFYGGFGPLPPATSCQEAKFFPCITVSCGFVYRKPCLNPAFAWTRFYPELFFGSSSNNKKDLAQKGWGRMEEAEWGWCMGRPIFDRLRPGIILMGKLFLYVIDILQIHISCTNTKARHANARHLNHL